MTVNGNPLALSSLHEIHSLKDLVHYFKLQPETIVVQRNGEVSKRKEWKNILLEEKDEIEFIRFVGGG